MKNILSYGVFIIFINFIKILPYKISKHVAIGLGTLIYHLAGKRNKIVKKNLKKAFPGEYTDKELENILKKVYHNLGMTFVEFMLMEKLSGEELSSYIRVEGEENLRRVQEKADGTIVYTAHFGNWEWQGAYFAVQGYPFTAIVRSQNNPYFNKRINSIRSGKGAEIVPKDISLRKVFKILKQGKYLYILGDQDARSRGWIMDFFGRSASTYPGPVRLAAATGSDILPVFMVREGWMKHRIVIYPSYSIEKNAGEGEQKQLLQQLTSLTEDVISKYPDQWFWLHRRWKSTR